MWLQLYYLHSFYHLLTSGNQADKDTFLLLHTSVHTLHCRWYNCLSIEDNMYDTYTHDIEGL